MSTACIIDDYVANRRSALMFNESQFKVVIDQWANADPLLAELQNWEIFKGKDTWDKLDPVHFKMLISTVFSARDKRLEQKDWFNEKLPLVQSLYFLLMGMAHCLQSRTGTAVDNMRVMRITDNDVSFEFNLSIIADKKPILPLPAPPKSGLKVVVDNTFNDK